MNDIKKTFLSIIPARGGSKRLSNKNIKDLCNKPLIVWTIDASLKSKYITNTLVSTDSKKIHEIASKSGAEVPFLRPSKLARDDAKSINVVRHAVMYYKEHFNKEFDYVILLQPTSPLRTQEDIDLAIELLINKNADAVVSVCEMEHSPIWSNKLDETLSMKNFLKKEFINKCSQDLEKYYRLNGAIYICKTNLLLSQDTFFIDDNIYAFKMSQESSVDIDTELDFLIAQTIIEKNNEYIKR